MSDKDLQRLARKRPTVSGALGRVLEQVESEGFSTDRRAAPVAGDPRFPPRRAGRAAVLSDKGIRHCPGKRLSPLGAC